MLDKTNALYEAYTNPTISEPCPECGISFLFVVIKPTLRGRLSYTRPSTDEEVWDLECTSCGWRGRWVICTSLAEHIRATSVQRAIRAASREQLGPYLKREERE